MIESTQQPNGVSTVAIPISQMGNLRHKLCVLGHFTTLSLYYEMMQIHTAKVNLKESQGHLCLKIKGESTKGDRGRYSLSILNCPY